MALKRHRSAGCHPHSPQPAPRYGPDPQEATEVRCGRAAAAAAARRLRVPPQLDEIPLDPFELALLALEVVGQRVSVLVEKVRVHLHNSLAVAGVHADLVIADAAGQP